jgi:putative thioredoxin
MWSKAPKTAASNSPWIRETTTATFMKDVIEQSMKAPVLVDFWAPWCGPCTQLSPTLEKLVHEAEGRIKLVKMNIDDHPSVAGQLGIKSIPAVIVFDQAQMTDGFMGALPEGRIREFIERLIGPLKDNRSESALQQAADLLEAGDVVEAANLFAAVLLEEPENTVALGGLVRCHIALDNLEEAARLLGDARDASLKQVRAALELAQKNQVLDDLAQLKQAVEIDPSNHRARLELALALAARDHKEEAANHLLTIVKKDRTFEDDRARKELLALFEAWGPTDPVTLSARRQLSMLLFA